MRSRWISPCVIVLVSLAGPALLACQELKSASDSKTHAETDSRAGTGDSARSSPGSKAVAPASRSSAAPAAASSSTASSGTSAPKTAAPGAAGSGASPAVGAQPASLFDALSGRMRPVMTTIEVRAAERGIDTGAPEPFVAGGEEILSNAGTWGDVSRFLETLPGVTASNDLSNEVLVRGGHPMENLFLVDGIEVPNINHLATMGTTGGFGPMIDTGVIQRVALFNGGYDAQYPERLSSVIDIQTLNSDGVAEHAEGDLGIEGVGGCHRSRSRILST